MKRKAYEGSDLLPGMEEQQAPAGPSFLAASRRAPKSRLPRLTKVRVIGGSVALVLLAATSLFAFHAAEEFLIRDTRFTISSPHAENTIQVIGAAHASPQAIEAVFAKDAGRSLYLLPLSERLTALRQVPWVRDASIARVWPNRVLVQVTERTPVAFVTLPSSRSALIDADGYVLPLVKAPFDLPVLRGVKPADSLDVRQAMVQRMLRLTAELGAAVNDISEIDVSKSDSISVSRPYRGRALKLLLGDRDLAARYNNFVRNMSAIESRAPGAKVLDLRLDDSITVLESVEEE